jgi:type III secretion system YscD/HrpQ family protein
MAKLVAIEGELQGMELALKGATSWVIGRDPDICQILLEDLSVSRQHLFIQEKEGKYLLENLSETNPLQVNGEELNETIELQEGDRIRVGALVLLFTLQDGVEIPQEEAPQEKEEEPAEELPEEPLTSAVKEEDEENLFEGKIDTIFDEEVEEENLLAQIDFNIPEDSRWLLKVIAGPNSGAEFHLQPEVKYIIGADPELADIIFYDTSVSKKHASLLLQKDETLALEDLHSKNGVAVDGEKVEGKATIFPNSVISLGTTSFVVFDRESKMQTIISPLMPSIVNVLKKKEEEAKSEEEERAEEKLALQASEIQSDRSVKNASSFILIALAMGFFLLAGIGTLFLFQAEPVEKVQVADADLLIKEALTDFPAIQYSYNPYSQTLLLVGHVLTDTEKRQLEYKLQSLRFLKSVDDRGVVIDEYVWKEVNTILAKNPEWSGVSIQATQPGHYVLSGYLKTRRQRDSLMEYLNSSFPYLDRLSSRLAVEEDLQNRVSDQLLANGIRSVKATFLDGNLVLKGRIAESDQDVLNTLVESWRTTPGIRSVDMQVVKEETVSSIVDITDRYLVSGTSRSGNSLSVIIDGRILTVGDLLDGMQITEITPSQILLEKEGIIYRIRLR